MKAGDPSVASMLRKSGPYLGLVAMGFLLLFWPTISGLVSVWAEDPEFSHGFLIPVICGAVLFTNRKELGALPARGSLSGLAVVLVSLLVFFAGCVSSTDVLQRLGLFGTFIGSVYFLFGLSILVAKPFPFFFLLFAIPPPSILSGPFRMALKSIATRLSSHMLLLMGISAMPEGNILAIGAQRLEVADACSGIRSLTSIVTTAVLFAYLFKTGFWRGLLLTLTALPVTILLNVLRIIGITVALTSFHIDLTQGTVHSVIGLAVFGLSIAFLYTTWRFYEWFFRWKELSQVIP